MAAALVVEQDLDHLTVRILPARHAAEQVVCQEPPLRIACDAQNALWLRAPGMTLDFDGMHAGMYRLRRRALDGRRQRCGQQHQACLILEGSKDAHVLWADLFLSAEPTSADASFS